MDSSFKYVKLDLRPTRCSVRYICGHFCTQDLHDGGHGLDFVHDRCLALVTVVLACGHRVENETHCYEQPSTLICGVCRSAQQVQRILLGLDEKGDDAALAHSDYSDILGFGDTMEMDALLRSHHQFQSFGGYGYYGPEDDAMDVGIGTSVPMLEAVQGPADNNRSNVPAPISISTVNDFDLLDDPMDVGVGAPIQMLETGQRSFDDNPSNAPVSTEPSNSRGQPSDCFPEPNLPPPNLKRGHVEVDGTSEDDRNELADKGDQDEPPFKKFGQFGESH